MATAWSGFFILFLIFILVVLQAMFTKCSNCHSQTHGTDVSTARPGTAFIK